jgi:hypothetical protein
LSSEEAEIDSFLEGLLNVEALQLSSLVDNMNISSNTTTNDEFVDSLYAEEASNITSFVNGVYAENSAAVESYLSEIETMGVEDIQQLVADLTNYLDAIQNQTTK